MTNTTVTIIGTGSSATPPSRHDHHGHDHHGHAAGEPISRSRSACRCCGCRSPRGSAQRRLPSPYCGPACAGDEVSRSGQARGGFRTGLSPRRRGSCAGKIRHDRALRFDNLTLGYDRHPAVHHLSGEVAQGALHRRGRAERRRQVDAVQGHRRHAQAAGGRDRAATASRRATSPICRSRRDRPQLPDPVSTTSSPWACGGAAGLFGGIGRASARRSSRRSRRSA